MNYSKDYIPTEGDWIRQHEEMKEYMRTHELTSYTYKMTYKINDKDFTETVKSGSVAEAKETLLHNCSMVGMFPYDIEIVQIDN